MYKVLVDFVKCDVWFESVMLKYEIIVQIKNDVKQNRLLMLMKIIIKSFHNRYNSFM